MRMGRGETQPTITITTVYQSCKRPKKYNSLNHLCSQGTLVNTEMQEEGGYSGFGYSGFGPDGLTNLALHIDTCSNSIGENIVGPPPIRVHSPTSTWLASRGLVPSHKRSPSEKVRDFSL